MRWGDDLEVDGEEFNPWPLVRAAQQGDRTSFGELYRHYRPMVRSYIGNRLGDWHLAEDLVSETFVRAFGAIDRFTYRGKDVRAWLFTIARNALFDHQRSARYRRETVVDDRDLESIREVAVGDRQIDAWLLREEVLRCIDALNDDQRACIVLRFYEGESISKTAWLTGRTPEAVRALQYRALRRMHELFAGDNEAVKGRGAVARSRSTRHALHSAR